MTAPYSTRDDIIVISDEAHRTQYGRLALNMRKALPKAKFIGFTGTPLIDNAEKQLTHEVFGDYVSIYDFQQAVADGATLPLFYENRGEKLKLVDPTLNERIRERIETARREGELDEEQEEKLYREEQEFKQADHPFRVAIVCAMWLTGFDVKCLATLYLDKPLQGHTLMQAIARVNRVGAGKKHGLSIDYNGMLKSLRKALAIFAQGDRGAGKGGQEQDMLREDTEALAEYAAAIQRIRAHLLELGFELDPLIQAAGFDKQALLLRAVNALCRTDEQRRTFELLVEDMRARLQALFPHPGLFAYDQAENAISAIYHRLQGFRRMPDVSAMLQALYEVVDTAVATESAGQAGEAGSRYDLSAIDLARLRAEFERSPYKNVIMLNLKEKLAARLDRMLACNPTRMNLYEHYWAIIQAYNQDKDDAEIQRVFDALMLFNSELDQEERRYLREGLDNEDQLAVFDLLQKDTLNRSERERIKQIARELLERLLADKLRLDHWREKATAQAQIKIEIIDHLLLNLPPECYDPAEIELKANLVFAHLFASDLGGEKRVYH